MKIRVYLIAAYAIAVLAACNVSNSSVPLVSHAYVAGSTAITNAWGKLVDDPSGKLLAGVLVQLEPWRPCRVVPYVAIPKWPPPSAWPHPETLNCPAAIATTHTRADGKFYLSAPPGHYLLVIGTDSTTDLTRPTIHDSVTLTGGIEHLFAPTPCPSVRPPYYEHCLPRFSLVKLPAVELSGEYRLVTIDQKYERPCITGFGYQRTQRNVEGVVVDEWLTENNRSTLDAAANPKYTPPPGVPTYWGALSGAFTYNQGGSGIKRINGRPGCWTWNVQSAFFYNVAGLPYSIDPRSHWYSGSYGKLNHDGIKGNLMGYSQYPRDPRNFKDPDISIWP